MSMSKGEAIESLTEIVELFKEEISSKNKNATAILDIEDIESLKIALNIIQKQEFEISALNQVHNYDVKMIDEVKGEAVKLYKELEKKDKIIDLMLGRIDPFRLPIEEKTTESAKQYFEKKVEEE